MNRIVFMVPGPIRGKQRAGRMILPGGRVRSFNPKQTVSNEKLIRDYAALEMNGHAPFTGAMRLHIAVYKLPPKSWSDKKRKAAKYVTGKPDCDNIAKLIADALNKIVWHDDAQIADLRIERCYDLTEENTFIEIDALEGR